MWQKRSIQHPEEQVNLDDVLPGLREEYCDEPVFIEAEFFDWLKRTHADDLKNEVRDIAKYFLGQGGSRMSIESDGEKIELYLDSNADEKDSKFYMIMMKASDE